MHVREIVICDRVGSWDSVLYVSLKPEIITRREREVLYNHGKAGRGKCVKKRKVAALCLSALDS